MTDQPDRCPLCGGAEHDRYLACDDPACELPVKNWPRVAELVAIRDAAVAWLHSRDESGSRMVETGAEVLRLARQEAERNERPRTRAPESAD